MDEMIRAPRVLPFRPSPEEVATATKVLEQNERARVDARVKNPIEEIGEGATMDDVIEVVNKMIRRGG